MVVLLWRFFFIVIVEIVDISSQDVNNLLNDITWEMTLK